MTMTQEQSASYRAALERERAGYAARREMAIARKDTDASKAMDERLRAVDAALERIGAKQSRPRGGGAQTRER
jgi:Na+-translocating ferredoxin:NAD+ oxidoreductase RnfC subunit